MGLVRRSQDTLTHWGIPGQKWGVRRWQYPDGRFTEEGKERYFGKDSELSPNERDYASNHYYKKMGDGSYKITREGMEQILNAKSRSESHAKLSASRASAFIAPVLGLSVAVALGALPGAYVTSAVASSGILGGIAIKDAIADSVKAKEYAKIGKNIISSAKEQGYNVKIDSHKYGPDSATFYNIQMSKVNRKNK